MMRFCSWRSSYKQILILFWGLWVKLKTACVLIDGGFFCTSIVCLYKKKNFQIMLLGATGCMETSRLSDSDGCQATCVKWLINGRKLHLHDFTFQAQNRKYLFFIFYFTKLDFDDKQKCKCPKKQRFFLGVLTRQKMVMVGERPCFSWILDNFTVLYTKTGCP